MYLHCLLRVDVYDEYAVQGGLGGVDELVPDVDGRRPNTSLGGLIRITGTHLLLEQSREQATGFNYRGMTRINMICVFKIRYN